MYLFIKELLIFINMVNFRQQKLLGWVNLFMVVAMVIIKLLTYRLWIVNYRSNLIKGIIPPLNENDWKIFSNV